MTMKEIFYNMKKILAEFALVYSIVVKWHAM